MTLDSCVVGLQCKGDSSDRQTDVDTRVQDTVKGAGQPDLRTPGPAPGMRGKRHLHQQRHARRGQRHHFLRRVDNERLLSFVYSAADAFVLPTRADDLPKVLIEAMACGTPLISFDIGGVPNIDRHKKTGLLAPPEDVRVLRGAIETVLRTTTLCNRMAEACRRVAVEEFASQVQAVRYAALYEDLNPTAARAAA